MTRDRPQHRWIAAGWKASQFETFMVTTVQGLGTLDCELALVDAYLVANLNIAASHSDEEAIAYATVFTRHITLSYLWVLGAYELVRSIDQRYFSKDRNAPDLHQIKATKRQFSRLRMPLAKYEAEKANSTDSPIAYPAMNSKYGAAWQITEDKFITRNELAEALVTLLEGLPSQVQIPASR